MPGLGHVDGGLWALVRMFAVVIERQAEEQKALRSKLSHQSWQEACAHSAKDMRAHACAGDRQTYWRGRAESLGSGGRTFNEGGNNGSVGVGHHLSV